MDRSQWRGMPHGWHEALKNDEASLSGPHLPPPHAKLTPYERWNFPYRKTGVPTLLPVNQYNEYPAMSEDVRAIYALAPGPIPPNAHIDLVIAPAGYSG